jgi:pyridoxamine 5'-phosphate oxidase
MSTSLSDLRKEYSLKKLTKKDVSPDPFKQFHTWFEEAKASISGEPNAMILSTSSQNGHPSSRVVLLKDFSEKGFVFFTNYRSRKGNELEDNPFAALLFFWGELERQVRIEGRVEKISRKESSNYFGTRPRLSQIGALASKQSKTIEKRSDLEDAFHKLDKEFEGKEIPMPENWGGYIVIPEYFEFWQGRRSRLHDRISYTAVSGLWKIERLSP